MKQDQPSAPPVDRSPAMRKTVRKLYLVGCRIGDAGANISGHPAVIVVVAISCATWFVVDGGDLVPFRPSTAAE